MIRRAKFRLAIPALIALAAIALPAQQPEPSEPPQAALPNVWGPYGKGHTAIPAPNMAEMETVVAKQIQGFHNALRALAAGYPDAGPELSRAYGMLGQALHAYELWPSAEACYRNAHNIDASKFQWPHLLGIVLKEQGKAAEAQSFFEKAVAVKPDFAPAWAELGELFLEAGKVDEARAAFEENLEHAPQSAFAHFGMGRVALAADQPKEAVDWLDKAYVLAPQANRILYSMGLAYRKLGEVERGKTLMVQSGKIGVREYDPLIEDITRLLRGERVHMIRGRAAFGAGHYADAAREFRKALNADPESAPALVNLGVTLSKLNVPYEAMEHFRKALEIDPENRAALYNLGALTLSEGNLAEAEKLLRYAIKLEPDDRGAKQKLAEVLAARGELGESAAIFDGLIAENPDQLSPYAPYARLLAATNRYPEAMAVLEAGLKVSETNYVLTNLMARLLAASPDPALRDGARAVSLAQNSVMTDPNMEHMETMALAFAEVGDCEKAAAWFQRALEAASKTPDNPRIPGLRAQLERALQGPPCRPPTAQAEAAEQ